MLCPRAGPSVHAAHATLLHAKVSMKLAALPPPCIARPWMVMSVLVVLALTGCAVSPLDPKGVGSGRYFQILHGDRVIVEMDTSTAGMMDCSLQASMAMQQTPSLSGRTRCSDLTAPDPLPYSFRAHRQLTESDGYKRSSPYLTRTSTSQLCTSFRDAARKMEKTVIVEEGCAPIAPADRAAPPPAPAQRTTAPTSGPKTVSDRLRQLEQLKNEGLLTEEEYSQRRKAILDQL